MGNYSRTESSGDTENCSSRTLADKHKDRGDELVLAFIGGIKCDSRGEDDLLGWVVNWLEINEMTWIVSNNVRICSPDCSVKDKSSGRKENGFIAKSRGKSFEVFFFRKVNSWHGKRYLLKLLCPNAICLKPLERPTSGEFISL